VTWTPLVSVLTPSLNHARFVEDCLVSVARQDYQNIEHVIVDGGSTDGTLEAVRRYEGDGCRILVLPQSSQAGALNAALAESRGDVIGWVNTDDGYFGVDAVSCAVAALRDDGECLAVYGDGVIVDERGVLLRHVSTSAAALAKLPPLSPLVQPATFVRRKAVDDGFVREDLEVVLDYELWLRLSRKGRFRKVERVLAVDRDHGARKTQVAVARKDEELGSLADEYGLHRGERGAAARARAWGRRVRGLREVVAVESRYDFAFPVTTDARWRRAARQLLLPQRYLERL
jgi:glycosyltransferase involved in cell wall biosynthesis